MAANLLRRASQGDRVTVVDPCSELGRGVAYANLDPCMLLNVRAGGMSAFPEEPGHFVLWLEQEGLAADGESSTVFASRRDYGAYLGNVLDSCQAESAGELVRVHDLAQGIVANDEMAVVTDHSGRIRADRVVLAIGNRPPTCPASLSRFASHPRFIANPWDHLQIGKVDSDEVVFILGAGLTMVDVVLLLTRNNHRGRIVVRSRRGLMPKPHRLGQPTPMAQLPASDELFKSVIQLMRASGDDWRSALDGLRPHTVEVWESLSWRDRKRFLTHLRPFWDVFRHRMPECAAEQIQEGIDSGQLDARAGRVCNVREVTDGFEVTVSGCAEPIFANRIVNCTGPSLDLRIEKVPILESVVHAGLADYDPFGLGLNVDRDGRTEEAGRIWALGPLCRGCRWETTAIPEIRVQAARIALNIMDGQ